MHDVFSPLSKTSKTLQSFETSQYPFGKLSIIFRKTIEKIVAVVKKVVECIDNN